MDTNVVLLDGSSSLTAESRPAFQPSATSLVAMSLGVTQLGSTTIGVVPLRGLSDAPAAWGLQLQAGFDGLNSGTFVGVGYRFDPRWLAGHRYLALASSDGAEQADGRARLHLRPLALLPAITLSYASGVAVEPHVTSHDGAPSLHLARVNLSERVGVYLELEATAAVTWRRVTPTSGWSTTPSASVSVLVNLPWFAGARPYDRMYLTTGLQRGLALGPTWLIERCSQLDVRCGAVLHETLLAGAAEVRLAPPIRPRLTVGRRSSRRFDPAGREVDASGLEVSLQLALSI